MEGLSGGVDEGLSGGVDDEWRVGGRGVEWRMVRRRRGGRGGWRRG